MRSPPRDRGYRRGHAHPSHHWSRCLPTQAIAYPIRGPEDLVRIGNWLAHSSMPPKRIISRRHRVRPRYGGRRGQAAPPLTRHSRRQSLAGPAASDQRKIGMELLPEVLGGRRKPRPSQANWSRGLLGPASRPKCGCAYHAATRWLMGVPHFGGRSSIKFCGSGTLRSPDY